MTTKRRPRIVRPGASWAQTLPDDFLLCRDIGHTWRPLSARIHDSTTYERTMRCGRCRTERHQLLTTTGTIVSGGYDYQEGYLAPPNTGRLTSGDRDGVRLESILRLIGHDSVDVGQAG